MLKVGAIVWSAIGYALFVLVVYFVAFWEQLSLGLPADPAIWGQFGDYLSGTLNPAISLVTLWYLVHSYVKQVKQMDATLQDARQQTTSMAVRESVALLIPELDRLDKYLSELMSLERQGRHIDPELRQSILRSIQIVDAVCAIHSLGMDDSDKFDRLVAVSMRSKDRLVRLTRLLDDAKLDTQSTTRELLVRAGHMLTTP